MGLHFDHLNMSVVVADGQNRAVEMYKFKHMDCHGISVQRRPSFV